MRTQAASNIPCALVRPPSVSGAALRDLSSAPACMKQSRAAIRADDYQIEPRITCVDRAIIRDYFHQHLLEESVRPAWRKSLFPEPHRHLPWELERRLSVPFLGHERIVVGNDVLLVETATREIVDVMRSARTTGGPAGRAARAHSCADIHRSARRRLPGSPAARWRHDERVAILQETLGNSAGISRG